MFLRCSILEKREEIYGNNNVVTFAFLLRRHISPFHRRFQLQLGIYYGFVHQLAIKPIKFSSFLKNKKRKRPKGPLFLLNDGSSYAIGPPFSTMSLETLENFLKFSLNFAASSLAFLS